MADERSASEIRSGGEGLRLLGEVAHDLRSPLTSILFLSETLRAARGQPIGPTQERQLMLIYSAAFELCALADDLTALGRDDEHLLEPRPVPFSLDNVLAGMHETLELVAEERNVEIRLPRTTQGDRLGHPAALGRVLLNLVMNSLRGIERGFVEVRARPLSSTRVEFAVRDSGGVVPEAVLGLLNGPADVRALVRAPRLSGGVLGMEICRRLVSSMGSVLEVREEADRGASLYFALELPPVDEVGREVVRKAEAGMPVEPKSPEHRRGPTRA